MQSGALQHQLLKVRSVESPNGSMIAIKMRALPTRVCLTLKQCLYVCRWASAQKPYHVPHVWGYEPWGIMERAQIPLFDESFRGYGMNKITWSRHIASLGYNFVVHPTAFMVHQPHHISCAKQAWWTGKPTNSKADRFLGAGGPALQLLLTKTAYDCTHVHTHLASLRARKLTHGLSCKIATAPHVIMTPYCLRIQSNEGSRGVSSLTKASSSLHCLWGHANVWNRIHSHDAVVNKVGTFKTAA